MSFAEPLTFSDVAAEMKEWHDRVMPDETKEAIANHLKEEAKELVIATFVPGSRKGHSDLEEAADVLLCLIAWAQRGYGLTTLLESAYDKMQVNKARTWQKDPTTGTYYHV